MQADRPQRVVELEQAIDAYQHALTATPDQPTLYGRLATAVLTRAGLRSEYPEQVLQEVANWLAQSIQAHTERATS